MKFLYLRHAAQFDERHAPRFFRRHSGAQIVFDMHGQMAFQLFGEFMLAAPAIQHPEEPRHPAAHLSNVHHDSSSGAKKRARISVVVSHFWVSWASRLRPARVNLYYLALRVLSDMPHSEAI